MPVITPELLKDWAPTPDPDDWRARECLIRGLELTGWTVVESECTDSYIVAWRESERIQVFFRLSTEPHPFDGDPNLEDTQEV